MTAACAVFIFTGFDVTCDGEFQGISCGIDGCKDTHQHNYKVMEEVKATCTEDGYTKYECKKCHYINTVINYKMGHDFSTVGELHRGICHEGEDRYSDGSWYDELICSRCDFVGKSYYYEGWNLHFYDEGEYTQLDECGCGRMTYTCLICGDKQVYDYRFHCNESPQQAELNSLYENNLCGTFLATCELCHRSVTKIWHRYTQEEWLVEPTETEYGLKKITCINENCRTSDNRTLYGLIPPTGQN